MAKDYVWHLTDLASVPKNGYKVFTTFSCGGGSSMGYKLAGYEVLGNCEIDPAINAMYVKNFHPKYNFLMGVQDFYKQDHIPDELFDIDVLDGSPPCFVAGTLVKTGVGYKPIEAIEVGDMVLTHKGRYRRVYSVMSKHVDETREVAFIEGACWYSVVCTKEHPFLVFDRSGDDVWRAAGELNASDMLVGIKEDKRVYYDVYYMIGSQGADVYNLAVEEDESYTVTERNVAVHNCSVFSMAGGREKYWGVEKHFREGQAKQVLDDLFFEYLNVVELLKPKVCVAENVKGMIGGNAKGYVNLIFKRFRELGYDTQLFLLNSATMGVPQKRERVFFIARRQDLCLGPVTLQFNEKPIVYGEFADKQYKPLNQATMEYKRWLKRSPQDDSIGDTVKRTEHGKISGFTSPYLKLNRVPSTLTAGGGMVRFDVPGKPSDKDVITIQSFPQDYDFNGNDPTYVCGMSVPPLMMRGVADEVRKQLLDNIK